MTDNNEPRSAAEVRARGEPRFALGLLHFNAGRFFEAHESWEELWRSCHDSERRFLHSLIHAAVALYQWNRGNRIGARLQAERGLRKSREFTTNSFGVDSVLLWSNIQSVLQGETGSPLPPDFACPLVCPSTEHDAG